MIGTSARKSRAADRPGRPVLVERHVQQENVHPRSAEEPELAALVARGDEQAQFAFRDTSRPRHAGLKAVMMTLIILMPKKGAMTPPAP